MTESLTPWGGIVDGDQLLTKVEEFLARFVAYPSEAARIAHTLWIAHSWFMHCWDSRHASHSCHQNQVAAKAEP